MKLLVAWFEFLDSGAIVTAQAVVEDWGHSVRFEVNETAKQVLAEVSRRDLQRPIRFVLEGVVVTEPTVQEPLLEGKALISGQLRLEEAQDIAACLASGPLPVELEVSKSKP